MISYSDFVHNCKEVERRVASASPTTTVKWIPVTKSRSIEAVAYAWRYGFTCVGENRVQEAIEKKKEVKVPIQWELIGHLQSNKAKEAILCFDRIQSVDSLKLGMRLQHLAAILDKDVPILLQVNTGEDPAKFGLKEEEVEKTLEVFLACSHLKVEGFMTVAPRGKTAASKAFARLRELRNQSEEQFGVSLPELSMGMSDDMEEAIREGSTCIRIGTALFGK